MARTRLLRMGPPVRGLTDFPEHATPEHSTQATNIEFCYGGARARQGSFSLKSSFYLSSAAATAPCTIKLVAPYTDATDASGPFSGYAVVGLVPLAGAEAYEERLIVCRIGDGYYGNTPADAPTCSSQVHVPDITTVDWTPGKRWDSCKFWPMGYDQPRPVVCTSHVDSANSTLFMLSHDMDGTASFEGIVGVNRTISPYNDGVTYFDDPGTYVTYPMRARFCRPHKNRLVIGNIQMNGPTFKGIPNDSPCRVWVSNYGDAFGWCLENIVPVHDKDMSPLTGLGTWMGNVVIFRNGSIGLFRMDGLNPSYREVVTNRGCASHSTIIDDVNGGCVFLAWDGVYAFTGSSELTYLSGPIERTLRALGAAFPAAHATHYPKHRQVWFTIPRAQTSHPDTVFVMDYGAGGQPAWSIFEYGNLNSETLLAELGGFACTPSGNQIYGLKQMGTAFGTEVLYWQLFDHGKRDNDNAAQARGYPVVWESGPFQYGMNEMERWRYIRPIIRQDVGTGTLFWRKDGLGYDGTTFNAQSVALDINPGSGVLVGAFVVGTDRLGGEDDVSIRCDVHTGGLGRYGRFGVSMTADSSIGQGLVDIRGAEIDEIDKLARR